MNTLEFLSNLRTLDIKLWIEGESLHYSAPKGLMTPEIRTELTKRKAEILTLLSSSSENAHSVPAKRVRTPGMPLLASFTQQRLWFLQQLMPESSLYNMPIALKISGLLNTQALHASFQTIVERHEVLRTTFQFLDGQVVQIIAAQCLFGFSIVDLQALPPQKQQATLTQLTSQQADLPFNLSLGPLLRMALVRLSQHEHILLITAHHVVVDGWSKGVIIQELSALYPAYCKGLPSPLAPLPLQYADYALWQREWLQGGNRARQLTYWKQQLADAPPFLNIPTDYPRPVRPSSSGASYLFRIETDLNTTLRTVSQQEGTTPIMTLLAAFQILLAYYTQQYDIVIGMVIAGRNHLSLEPLVGCFINMLVLRTGLSGNPNFREVLRLVKEVAFAAYAHQDLPFEQLVEEIKPARNPGYSPLFQIEYSPQPAALSQQSLAGLNLQQLRPTDISVKFDITLDIVEDKTGFDASLTYNRDLFEASTIEGMARNYLALLNAALTDPDAQLESLKRSLKDPIPEHKVFPDPISTGRLPTTANSTTNGSLASSKELERIITTVWQEVLQADDIGTDDNFFDLGGHSLLTIEVANKLSSVLKQEVNLIDFFHYPTIRSFAEHLLSADEVPTVQHEITERAQKQKEAFKRQRMKKHSSLVE